MAAAVQLDSFARTAKASAHNCGPQLSCRRFQIGHGGVGQEISCAGQKETRDGRRTGCTLAESRAIRFDCGTTRARGLRRQAALGRTGRPCSDRIVAECKTSNDSNAADLTASSSVKGAIVGFYVAVHEPRQNVDIPKLARGHVQMFVSLQERENKKLKECEFWKVAKWQI